MGLAFIAAALAWWGVQGLAGSWAPVTVVASGLSLVLLIAFWDVQLLIGVLIGMRLIGVAVFRPSWLHALLP